MFSTSRVLLAVFLLAVLARFGHGRFLDNTEEVEEVMGGGGEESEEREDQGEEDLSLPILPDPVLLSLQSRLPVYVPDFVPEDWEDSDAQYAFPSPLKRGRYNRLDILKRSRLNQLIHRLLAMRGDRYSYHRASPVRFAAGRR